MTRFIKVADEIGTCNFINLDNVVKVSCGVTRKKKGGGFNIESVTDSAFPKTSPVTEDVLATIVLFTANGAGNVHFDDLSEAARWAKEHLNIDVPFNQL